MKKSALSGKGSARFRPVLLFVMLLAGALSAQTAEGGRTWFFFRDKGPAALQKKSMERAAASLSERALARRARVAPAGRLVDDTDLPVWSGYLEELAALGIEPVVISNWLNGVSAKASPAQIAAAANLACISRIQPVLRGRRPLPALEPALNRSASTSGSSLQYGHSLEQLEQIQIPAVHELGIYGQGVCIAVFDTGFRLNHEVFDSLRVLHKRDFIQNDEELDNQPGERSDQNSHGTMVLSIIAANKPGVMIGGAPRAEFILAKTEDVAQEIQAEEDNWIAAAEWAEALGADIFSTSLGYIDWYTYADMDGNTAPITRAADLAAGKGVVVVVAAGNEGNDIWQYISAPADGDSVLAVGAVDAEGIVASFSSRGPTSDGRIKPDVMARGIGVACIEVPPASGTGSGYRTVNGTSAACPLAASAAALLLCANPELTPVEILDALRKSATLSLTPDIDYGWGILQCLAAVETTSSVIKPVIIPERPALAGIFPNPAHAERDGTLTLVFDLVEPEEVDVRLYNVLGQEVGRLFQGKIPAGTDRRVKVRWPAGIQSLGSGLYFVVVRSGSLHESRAVTLLLSPDAAR
ncbi:MAG TPA: S8 family serine peptidase [bacterium]|nr:S8 family serine peptidase [bacterium]